MTRGILFATVCLFFFAAADGVEIRNRKSASDEPVEISAEWTAGNGVKKLYDTPLGAVYSFHGSAPTIQNQFAFWSVRRNSRKNAARQADVAAVAYPLQLRLFKNDTEAEKKTRRYLFIEFSLRQFPVEQDTGMELLLFASPDLYGISDLARAIYFISPFFSVKQEKHRIDRLLYSRNDFLPEPEVFRKSSGKIRSVSMQMRTLNTQPWDSGPFELFHCRILLDTSNKNDRFCALNLNGDTIHITGSGFYDPVPGEIIRSIGFVVSAGRDNSTIWEISAPKVSLIENLEDLRNLPALTRESYPYEKYPALSADRLGKSKNPDELYAQALHLLNGKQNTADFAQAAELLGKAERKNHIPARYLLALCHLRGAGVKKDLRTAEKYLKDCVKYHYGKAIAMQLMLDAEKEPLNSAVKPKPLLPEKDLEFFFRQMPDGVTSAFLQNKKVEFSVNPANLAWNPKLALLAVLRGKKGPSKLLDYAVKEQYPPALAVKAREALPGKYDNAIRMLTPEKIQSHPMCRLEFLRLKTLAGTAVKKDFENQPVELWENPLFYLLRHAAESPDDAPALRMYLETGRDTVLETLQKSPGYDFLRGCALLARMMDLRRPDTTEKTVNEAVTCLKRAASSHPDAAYLLACLYQDGKFVPVNPMPGRQYLDNAVRSGGNPAALLRKAKQQMNTSRNAALALLKKLPSCPEALYLMGELLLPTGKNKEAYRYIQRAAKLNYPDAWLQMGNIMYAGNYGIRQNKANACICWGHFLALDKERRQNDITDFYWEHSRPPRPSADNPQGGKNGNMILEIIRGKEKEAAAK